MRASPKPSRMGSTGANRDPPRAFCLPVNEKMRTRSTRPRSGFRFASRIGYVAVRPLLTTNGVTLDAGCPRGGVARGKRLHTSLIDALVVIERPLSVLARPTAQRVRARRLSRRESCRAFFHGRSFVCRRVDRPTPLRAFPGPRRETGARPTPRDRRTLPRATRAERTGTQNASLQADCESSSVRRRRVAASPMISIDRG